MTVGPYSIFLLETGEFALDGGAMFGVVPKNIWQKNHPTDDQNRIDMALRIMLIQGPKQTILIDTGIGEKWDPKYEAIYRISHEKYSLKKALSQKGIAPDAVTDIILTHLHFDHTGGCTYQQAGKLELTFSKANHYVQKQQWDWAMQPTEKDRASFLKENFEPLTLGKLILLEGEKEIYPGIQILISHGHTRSQQVVKISDGAKTLLYCGDLIPTASHVPIPYVMGYDNFPLITMEEKRTLLERAVREHWVLCFEHDPKIAAATVQKDPKTNRFSIEKVVTF
ncbi:MAG: MBL fold metallo-hydrolase [Deltaproteobacteria bacterium]|nr:MBL fold metallo-hydrolase [Deltaproteobacteria bacterium]